MRQDGIITGFFFGPARHLYRLLVEPEYRRYSWLVTRYGRSPRYKKRTIKLNGLRFIVPDIASFLSAFKEIFVERIYSFPTVKTAPLILDCGANIGLSALYFKKHYPGSKVVAYEADPGIFEYLKNNVLSNGLDYVELHNNAIWSSNTIVEFSIEGSDSGRINSGSDRDLIKVPAVALRDILKKCRFDFVKIDIEGAEVEALRDCYNELKDVPYVFVEYHSFRDNRQELGQLISAFEQIGFRVHIHPPFISKTPFLGVKEVNSMDMQLNLFFLKER